MMKTYLLARFDLTLNIFNESLDLKDGEIAFLENQNIDKVVVKSKEKYFESYTFDINECLRSECDFVRIKKLNNQNLLIELLPKQVFLPKNIQKKVILYEEHMFCVEVYNGIIIKVYTDSGEYTLTKKGIKNFRFDIINCHKKLLFLIFNFEDNNYYFIFKGTELIFSGFLKEFNIKDTHLILLNDDVSCYGQKQVLDLDIKENTQQRYFVYGDDREVFDKIDTLYLFLDAVKIKNYEICKQYLSNDLCEIEEDSFFEFFENFDEFRFIDDVCILEKNNEVIKIVHFEVLNDKIVNIYD